MYPFNGMSVENVNGVNVWAFLSLVTVSEAYDSKKKLSYVRKRKGCWHFPQNENFDTNYERKTNME